jgi:hypothetical protein
MMFEDEKDWKECLAEEDQAVLAEIFEHTKRHKCAYCGAEDVKVAQIWCALLEFKKEFDILKAQMTQVRMPFQAIIEMGEVEKRKTVDRLVRDMLKPEPDKEEQTRKLVDSLMKF